MLLIDTNRLIIDSVYNFNLEVFGIVLVCHVAGDYALKQIFVDASGSNMVNDGLHALDEVVGVPVVAIMDEEPDTDCQGDTFVRILEIMART